MQIALRIDRGPPAGLDDGPLLEAAVRALTEAQTNLDHARLRESRRMNRREVGELAAALSSDAWATTDLVGEAPTGRVHRESSAWEAYNGTRGGIPWLVLAADVMDFVAAHMGEHDWLILKTQ